MHVRVHKLPVTVAWMACVGLGVASVAGPANGQSVLFDFNNAPLHSSLPINLTVGGITAAFSATGQGFSIQDTSAPVVPVGFTGRFIYPNSVFAADLLIGFDRTLTDFSILYAPQELGCDDSATMRVTASMNGSFVGTNIMTATNPGTWPADTLSCSFPQGFNSVVVHYDSKPSTCQDWGPIFLADDMRVTAQVPAPWTNLGSGLAGVSGVPALVGTGTLVAGSPAALNLSNAKPSTACVLLVALESIPAPFKGGVLLAFPPVVSVLDASLANGTLPLPFTWPSGIPAGMSFWIQYLVSDAAAVQKVALSNAMKATTP